MKLMEITWEQNKNVSHRQPQAAAFLGVRKNFRDRSTTRMKRTESLMRKRKFVDEDFVSVHVEDDKPDFLSSTHNVKRLRVQTGTKQESDSALNSWESNKPHCMSTESTSHAADKIEHSVVLESLAKRRPPECVILLLADSACG